MREVAQKKKNKQDQYIVETHKQRYIKRAVIKTYATKENWGKIPGY